MECSNFFNAHINKVFKIHLSKIGNVFKSCVNDASYTQLRKLLDNNKRCPKLARPEKANIFTTQSLRHSWQLDHKKSGNVSMCVDRSTKKRYILEIEEEQKIVK